MSADIPKLRTPVYPEVEARRKLTKKERAQIVLRQDGKCAGCGIKPRHGWEFDHDKALWKGGTDQGDLDTWRALGSREDCTCHADKTAGEAGERAQMRRLRGETGQIKRRKARGGSMIKNAAKIQSRGFSKGLRKRMNGKVERVET
jgi:hypothetical protein